MALALKLLISLPLLFLLPGYLLLRLVSGRGLSPLRPERRCRLFLSSLISILIASWSALILAQLGIFSLSAIITILLLIAAVFLLLSRGAPWRLPGGSWTWAMPVLAALGILSYAPPYEYVLGIWDPGVYVNAGAHCARTGSILIHDRVLPEVPAPDRELFYDTRFYTQRYEGMAVVDAERGIVSPHFYHLYTVWVALFHAIAGLRFSLWVNTVFALLSLAAFYCLSREIAGGRTAFIASLLLLCSAPQAWAARFPDAEMLAQFLMLSGLFCLIRYEKDGVGFWAMLAGACFAELLLTVFTAVTIVPLLALVIFWRNWDRWEKADAFLLIPLGLGLLHLVLQDMTVCRSYTKLQLEILSGEGLTPRLLLAGVLASLLLLLIARAWFSRLKGLLSRFVETRTFRIALGAALMALVAFGYFVRPRLSNAPDARNLLELAWFLYPIHVGRVYFPLGLFFILAGALLFIRTRFDAGRGTFFLIACVSVLLLLHRKMVFPSYPWALRRYLPLAYPSLIFFMAYALAWPAERMRRGWVVTSCLAVALIAMTFLRYTRYVRPVDFCGTIRFLEQLASPLDAGGLFVCEGSGIAAPLDCVHGLDVLHLRAQTPHKCRGVERVMQQFIARGRRVYYISRGGWPISRTLSFAPVCSQPLATDHLDYTVGEFRGRRVPLDILARVFRVEPLGDRPESGLEARTVDIGEDCFGLISGFGDLRPIWDVENGKRVKRWARWTGGDAELVIPTFGARADLVLTLRASAGRERPVPEVPVGIFVDGRKAADLKVTPTMEEHRCILPVSMLPPGKARATLKLVSPTWRPAAGGSPADIGICIDWIRVDCVKE